MPPPVAVSRGHGSDIGRLLRRQKGLVSAAFKVTAVRLATPWLPFHRPNAPAHDRCRDAGDGRSSPVPHRWARAESHLSQEILKPWIVAHRVEPLGASASYLARTLLRWPARQSLKNGSGGSADPRLTTCLCLPMKCARRVIAQRRGRFQPRRVMKPLALHAERSRRNERRLRRLQIGATHVMPWWLLPFVPQTSRADEESLADVGLARPNRGPRIVWGMEFRSVGGGAASRREGRKSRACSQTRVLPILTLACVVSFGATSLADGPRGSRPPKWIPKPWDIAISPGNPAIG